MTSSERVPPDANFFYYPRGPSAREAVHFIDLTPDRNEAIVSRVWRFGDGSTASGPWPIHLFECGGDYHVEACDARRTLHARACGSSGARRSRSRGSSLGANGDCE